MRLERNGEVFVLTMDEPSQVINGTTIADFNSALDEVEASSGPAALVLTGEGKTFSQGLDLPYIGGLGDQFSAFIDTLHKVFARLYRLDMPTAAGINGHAIAAGAMLTLCCDVRIMRADRGWWRLPEVELNMPFTTAMNALISARVPQPGVHQLMVLGLRVGGAEAAALGAVDRAVEGEDAPLDAAIEAAAAVAVHRGPTLKTIRELRYRPLLEVIEGGVSF